MRTGSTPLRLRDTGFTVYPGAELLAEIDRRALLEHRSRSAMAAEMLRRHVEDTAPERKLHSRNDLRKRKD